MDPISIGTMAVIGMGASAAGSLVGAAGAEYQGAASANMYNYQSGLSQMSAQINRQNANYERMVGGVEAWKSGEKTRFERSSFIARRSGSNIDVNTGSSEQVADSITNVGRMDQHLIRANAARRAYGYEVQATQDEGQSQVYRMAAQTSRTAGHIGAASSILGGISSVSGQAVRGRSTGMF